MPNASEFFGIVAHGLSSDTLCCVIPRPPVTVSFGSSSLFQSHAAPTLLPQGSGQGSGQAKPASHTVHQSILPPKVPSSVDLFPVIGSAVSCSFLAPPWSIISCRPRLYTRRRANHAEEKEQVEGMNSKVRLPR